MRNSKQKAPCAYAKAGKSQSKDPHSKSEVPTSPRNKKCENMYEEIMKDLDLDQSEYILKLCKKNEEKMKKNQAGTYGEGKAQQFQDISNLLSQDSQRSINHHKKESALQSKTNLQTPAISKRNSKKQKKPTPLHTPPTPAIQSSQQQFQSQCSSSQSEESLNPYFLSNLDHYIARLNQGQQKAPRQFFEKTVLNKYSSQDQRQFRRTVQLPSKSKKSNDQLVTRAKYSKLLDNLHDQIVEKQALEYKLECKDIKMAHMKKIIQSMHHEILFLQKQLHEQKSEKEKYSLMAQEFVTKVHHARVSSREKHYIPHHQKRNSHIPSSNSYNNDFNEYGNKTGWQEGKSNILLRNEFERRSKEEMSTLKKKGMHKYKMSELYNEGNQSIQDRASIYRDSYL